MIIEGHTVDAAILRDIVDRDLRDRLLKEQVLQGLFQRSLCNLGQLRHLLNALQESLPFALADPANHILQRSLFQLTQPSCPLNIVLSSTVIEPIEDQAKTLTFMIADQQLTILRRQQSLFESGIKIGGHGRFAHAPERIDIGTSII